MHGTQGANLLGTGRSRKVGTHDRLAEAGNSLKKLSVHPLQYSGCLLRALQKVTMENKCA